MKKILLFAIVAMMSVGTVCAQSPKAFCLIRASEGLLKKQVSIQIDFGQKVKAFQVDGLVDENGKALLFNSPMDALNYMSSLGWEYEEAFAITVGNQNVYHFLMSKVIEDGVDVMEGLNTHLKHKEQQRMNE